MRPPRPEPLRILRVGYGHPDVARLVEEVQAEYVVLYGSPDDTPVDPAMFEPPAGSFFLGYHGAEPVAMGAWRWRGDVRVFGTTATAEIKRMYVTAAARRRGVSRLVLEHIERSAAAAGFEALVLETGLAQPEAIALYVSAGYTAVPAFGHYSHSPLSRCFGRALVHDRAG